MAFINFEKTVSGRWSVVVRYDTFSTFVSDSASVMVSGSGSLPPRRKHNNSILIGSNISSAAVSMMVY